MANLRPGDVAEAVLAVQDAVAAARTLEIVAAGSRQDFGRPVQADDILDLSALSGVIAYEHDELVLTALAATPLVLIQSLLRGRNQHLAFEPPDLAALWGLPEEQGTLGGALATGLGGSRRVSAGAPRDHFLGFKAVNGQGQAFSGGGKVVKNVTGYDLPKLMAGSFGTLVVLTEVTVKVMPAPPETRTLAMFGLTEEVALARLRSALGGPVPISGAAFLPSDIAARGSGLSFGPLAARRESVALLRLEGVAAAVVAGATDVAQRIGEGCEIVTLDSVSSQQLWPAIGSARLFAGSGMPVWRLSIPPSSAPLVGEALRRSGAAGLYFDWGGGAVWVEGVKDIEGSGEISFAAQIRQIAIGAGGHATLMRAASQMRELIDPFQPPEPGLAALQRRVQARFDPLGLFNPGRMYGRLDRRV